MNVYYDKQAYSLGQTKQKRTSNRSTPLGAQDGCNWILTVPVFPGTPSKLSTSKVTILPPPLAAFKSSAWANSYLEVAVEIPTPAKTAFFNHEKAARRRIADSSVLLLDVLVDLLAESKVNILSWWWTDCGAKASACPNRSTAITTEGNRIMIFVLL